MWCFRSAALFSRYCISFMVSHLVPSPCPAFSLPFLTQAFLEVSPSWLGAQLCPAVGLLESVTTSMRQPQPHLKEAAQWPAPAPHASLIMTYFSAALI